MIQRLLAIFLAAILFAPLPGQDSPTIRVSTNIIIAPTTVTDKNGNFVDGLEARDFKLYDNDVPQDIRQDVAFVPISLAVVIQKSSRTEPVLPAIKKIAPAIEGLVLGERGEAAVISFDHRIDVMQEFTGDGNKLKEALDKLKPGSQSSRLNDAVLEASRMLGKRPATNRRVILLISETRDRGSAAREKETLTQLELNNIMVYPVNMSRWLNKLLDPGEPPRPPAIPYSAMPNGPGGVPMNPTTAMQLGYGGSFGNYIPLAVEVLKSTKAIFVDNPQELYAKYTGGKEHSFVSSRTLDEAIAHIGEELHSQYLISYNPANKSDGGWHSVRVVVNRPGYDVRTRGGYWMAARPE